MAEARARCRHARATLLLGRGEPWFECNCNVSSLALNLGRASQQTASTSKRWQLADPGLACRGTCCPPPELPSGESLFGAGWLCSVLPTTPFALTVLPAVICYGRYGQVHYHDPWHCGRPLCLVCLQQTPARHLHPQWDGVSCSAHCRAMSGMLGQSSTRDGSTWR